ncbi:MAG: hypothetical protein IKE01_04045 [Clostridia bacterium]|nr:hypothetical protein [Clostridia bacterium]
MKVIKRILIIITIVIISTLITSNKAYAGKDYVSPSNIVNSAKDFLNDAGDGPEIINAKNGKSAVDQIYYIGLAIAIVAAVIIGIVLGIQFMTTGAAGQAKVKEKLIPFAVGALVVFGAFGIWKITYEALNKVL